MFAGINDALWGLRRVLTTPSLLRLALAPVLIAAIPIGLAWFGFRAIRDLASGLVARVGIIDNADVLASWLDGMFWAVAYVLLVVVLAIATTPFCEMISEKVECDLTGRQPEGAGAGRMFIEILRGMSHALRRALVYVFSLLVLMIVFILPEPIDNALYAVGTAYLTVRFTSWDSFDTLWARKNWNYRQKADYLRDFRSRAYGLGTVVALLVLVPGLNVFAFPAGAAGAIKQHSEATR